MITELTLEQAAQIPAYRTKWHEIMLAMGQVDQQQAIMAIQAAYQVLNRPIPNVMFCGNPQTAWADASRNWNDVDYGERLDQQFDRVLYAELQQSLTDQLSLEVHQQLEQALNQSLTSVYVNSGENELNQWLVQQFEAANLGWYIHPAWWSCAGAYMDFCITVLNCEYDPEKWQAFQALVQHCGWVFPYARVCLVCDRPITLLLPIEERLPEAFSGLLVQFADGFSLSRTSEQNYAVSFN